ncbi:MAG TPA: hypothetical protein VKS81_00775 [Bacteroidota bacterium]|nr:hypothetical protein [Bacteroidota bacterium]
MDYREAFVSRALELIKSYKGSVPTEVKSVIRVLGTEKDPHTLTSAEFNILQEVADRIDTQAKLNKVQKTIRRGAPQNGSGEMNFEKKPFYHHKRGSM